MVLTDPPYGVDYSSGESLNFKKINVKWDNIKGDELQTDEKYLLFTKEWIEKVIPYFSKYNTLYIFGSDQMITPLILGVRGAKIYYSQLIIWVKSSPVMGRKDYIAQHELIVYGWHDRHKRERGVSKSTLFYPKPHRSKLHPTMKPVGLLRQLILNSTKIGETVYDPFGGSGSTLIACEHTKRKCVMIEMAPIYVKTIIDRWEKLTGLKAEKVS